MALCTPNRCFCPTPTLPRASKVNNSTDRFRTTRSTSFNTSRRPPRASNDKRDLDEFRDTEDDPRYQMIDESAEHAADARLAFLACVSQGEGSIDLAEAALHIAAEDDALVSHSACRFPVDAFRKRLQRIAAELENTIIPPLCQQAASDDEILIAIMKFVFEDKQRGFSAPAFGRSAIPLGTKVDNPGVYEDARLAILPEVLIRRKGIPAALAILLSDILRRLLLSGTINFVAKIDCSDLSKTPTAQVLPGLTRDSVVRERESTTTAAATATNNNCTNADSTTPTSSNSNTEEKPKNKPTPTTAVLMLNTLSTDALVECLTHLKRAYWPFPWDGRRGGFSGAAKAWLDGAESAEAEAIARTAAHRLRRGIWTSPGAGDLRRAVAAAERLVILRGDVVAEERRDLAVLYCHAGMLREARAELKKYYLLSIANRQQQQRVLSENQQSGSTTTTTTPINVSSKAMPQLKLTLTPGVGLSAASSVEDLDDAVLTDRLATILKQLPLEKSKFEDENKCLTLETALQRCRREVSSPRILPLTW